MPRSKPTPKQRAQSAEAKEAARLRAAAWRQKQKRKLGVLKFRALEAARKRKAAKPLFK